MSEPVVWCVLVAAAFLAGALNTLAGGGSVVTLPVLVLVAGVPANIANGTNRVAVLVQCLVAALVFRKGQLGGGPVAVRLAPIACVGALAGAWLATRVEAAPMQRIMGIGLLLCLPPLLYRGGRLAFPAPGTEQTARRVHPVLVGLLALLIGVYGGFLQLGVGLFVLMLCGWAFRMKLVDANNAKVILVGLFTVVSLVLFATAGQVDPLYAVLLASGQALGSFVGARLVIRRGEGLLRWALAVAVVLSALQMIGLLRL